MSPAHLLMALTPFSCVCPSCCLSVHVLYAYSHVHISLCACIINIIVFVLVIEHLTNFLSSRRYFKVLCVLWRRHWTVSCRESSRGYLAQVSGLLLGPFSHSYPFSPMSVIIFTDIISRNCQVADGFHLFWSLLFVDVVLICHQVVASNWHWRSGLESSVKWWD